MALEGTALEGTTLEGTALEGMVPGITEDDSVEVDAVSDGIDLGFPPSLSSWSSRWLLCYVD